MRKTQNHKDNSNNKLLEQVQCGEDMSLRLIYEALLDGNWTAVEICAASYL